MSGHRGIHVRNLSRGILVLARPLFSMRLSSEPKRNACSSYAHPGISRPLFRSSTDVEMSKANLDPRLD